MLSSLRISGALQDPLLFWLWVVCSIKGVGWSLAVVIFPFYAREIIGMSATLLGWQWAINDGVQLIFTPLLGNLSDQHGRKWIICGCIGWMGLLLGLTTLARTAAEYIIVRAVSGVGQGVGFGAITAMVTDLAQGDKRPAALSTLYSIGGAAFIAGGGLNALLDLGFEMGYIGIFWSGGSLIIVSALIGARFMCESLPAEKRKIGASLCCCAVRDDNAATDWLALMTPGMILVLVGKMFQAMGSMFWYITYPYFIKDVFGWGSVEFGLIIACFGLVAAVFQLSCFPTITNYLGDHSTAALFLAIYAGSSAALPALSVSFESASRNHVAHLMIIGLMAVADACNAVAFPNLVASYVPEPGMMGTAQGITAAVKSIGWMVGPILGGLFYDSKGAVAAYHLGAALCVASLLAVLCSSVWAAPFGRKPSKESDVPDEDTPLLKISARC